MKKKIIQIIAMALFFSAISVGCYEKKIELINNNIVVELGDTFDIQPEELIDMEGIKSEDVHIDTSAVDANKVGQYVGTINYKSQTLEFTVEVQDTTPPQIQLSTSEVYLIPEQIFQISEIVESIEEVSGKVYLSSNEGNLLSVNTYAIERNINSVSYNDIELFYGVTTTAEEEFYITDDAQNATKFCVTFYVVNKPEIVVEDIQLVVGDEDALNEYFSAIKVVDDVDGEVYENIQYDTTLVDINTEGEYKLLVSYENTRGIANEKEVTVTVNKKPVKKKNTIPIPEGCNPLVLQKVIGVYCFPDEKIEYPADADVRDVEIPGRTRDRERGEWSNGEVTLQMACDELFDFHDWDEYTNGIYLHAQKILGYQVVGGEPYWVTLYLLEDGSFVKGAYYWHTDVQVLSLRHSGEYVEFFDGDPNGWIYY